MYLGYLAFSIHIHQRALIRKAQVYDLRGGGKFENACGSGQRRCKSRDAVARIANYDGRPDSGGVKQR